jgi:hypothetical protein
LIERRIELRLEAGEPLVGGCVSAGGLPVCIGAGTVDRAEHDPWLYGAVPVIHLERDREIDRAGLDRPVEFAVDAERDPERPPRAAAEAEAGVLV